MIEVLNEKQLKKDKPRVLVVDDEPGNLRLVEVKLRKDYEVAMVGSGEAAIQLLDDGEQFDLILLDQMMPGMDGIMTFAEMKRQELIHDMPVIMVTAHGSIKLVTAFMQMGGTDFIEKPIIDAEALKLRILQSLNTAEIIRKKRRMEEELVRIQKHESVGVLADGIAHDFKNMLHTILGSVSLAKACLDPVDEAYSRLTDAGKAGIRAESLAHQLLTFAEDAVPVMRVISIAELLRESASFALRGSAVGCKLSIPDDLWAAEVDEGQISQVINNLIINADQAMPEGGVIEVSAENIIVNAESDLPLEHSEYVRISIKDQGIGIPEEHLAKIFGTYFTTKQKGHGLGLAISHFIIKSHGGHITVESQVGVGTTFYIYISACPEQVPIQEEEAEENVYMGDGKILVMDNEESIIDITCAMLNNIGYEVTAARDGTEAIMLYREGKDSGHPFDAVLMDLTIPGGMGGREAIQELIAIDPGIKAIVSSGYSNDPAMTNFESYGFSDVIAKPYGLKELSKVLHKVIMSEQLA